MALFIKTERFNANGRAIRSEEMKKIILEHKSWVNSLICKGVKVSSGYLVNEKRIPGGGGLLVIEANSFLDAKSIIIKDPMIRNGIVDWSLQEWISINGGMLI